MAKRFGEFPQYRNRSAEVRLGAASLVPFKGAVFGLSCLVILAASLLLLGTGDGELGTGNWEQTESFLIFVGIRFVLLVT